MPRDMAGRRARERRTHINHILKQMNATGDTRIAFKTADILIASNKVKAKLHCIAK